MGESQSFDRAADFYDRTRDLQESVATHGIAAILEAAGPEARILDAGTGTGRISVPLLKHGADLIGLDLSLKMMAQLRGKFPSARLAQADASRLPFGGHQFDAVLTCHVMHLVGPWREALREFRRVLKPRGAYINAGTERAPGSARERFWKHWQGWIGERGGTWQHPGAQDDEEVLAELRALGATLTRIEAAHLAGSDTVGALIDAIKDRVHSTTRQIPDDMLAGSVGEMHAWARREYGPGYREQTFNEEATFVLDVARFDK